MNQKFYYVKGALSADAPSYIKRDADDMLYDALIEHKYCYVLNYRQIGKSSLKNSCSKRLEEVGHKTIHIDLSNIGSKDIEVEQWYSSFIFTIVKKLNLSETIFANYWLNKDLTVVSRVGWIVDELILKECPDKITIFIDEIDYILSINKFNTDDFFALIRSFYNKRGEDKQYNRLTFVLLGVASPDDLMQDSSRTPFNIAENIKISQLKFEQSYRLMDGLHNQTINKKEILKRVFEYTSGTSYLTQKILEDISKYPIASLNDIDSIVDRLFIQEGFNEVNLSNIQARIIQNKTHNVKMLYTIEQIQNGVKIENDTKRHTYIYLKLSGLIKVEDGLLVYSNLIYQKIFNAFWLERMIDKLDRPIVKFYQKWVQNGKSKKYLLKEETLQEIEKWAHNRSDLLAGEYNYLSISHQEENRNSRIKLEQEAQNLNNKLLEEEKKFNNKLLEEQEKYNNKLLKEQRKTNKRIIRMRQIFAIIVFFAVSSIIYSVIYSANKNAENEKMKLEYEKVNLKNEKVKLKNKKLKNEKVKLENEKIARENKTKQLDLEAKKTNDYYKKLLKAKVKGGTLEYYLWEIDTYEHLDDNKTNYKIAEASSRIGNIYKENNRSSEAEKFYRKAIEIYKKENKKYQKELAVLYYKIGSLDEALKIYAKNPEKYKIQRAKIYYEMADKFIAIKNIKQAEKFYNKGFEIYEKLLQKNVPKYIHIFADSLVKGAEISYLKKNQKEAKEFYIKSLNVYKKLDRVLYKNNIEKIENKLNQLKNIKVTSKRKHDEGWAYIGNFSKGKWKKRYWWLEKFNTISLKNSKAITIEIDGVNLRKKPSRHSKEIGGISLGSLVTIKKIKIYKKEDENHVWAYVKY